MPRSAEKTRRFKAWSGTARPRADTNGHPMGTQKKARVGMARKRAAAARRRRVADRHDAPGEANAYFVTLRRCVIGDIVQTAEAQLELLKLPACVWKKITIRPDPLCVGGRRAGCVCCVDAALDQGEDGEGCHKTGPLAVPAELPAACLGAGGRDQKPADPRRRRQRATGAENAVWTPMTRPRAAQGCQPLMVSGARRLAAPILGGSSPTVARADAV
jgi:hypothetical protein